jgi:hypothetical protein
MVSENEKLEILRNHHYGFSRHGDKITITSPDAWHCTVSQNDLENPEQLDERAILTAWKHFANLETLKINAFDHAAAIALLRKIVNGGTLDGKDLTEANYLIKKAEGDAE